MAKITIKKDRSGTGLQIDLQDDLDLLVGKGVAVERTDDGAVAFGYGNGHTAIIHGKLIGSQGIALGNERAVDNDETVIVGKTGRIDGVDVGINVAAWGSEIINAGKVRAEFGVFLGGISADTTTRITNSGTIYGNQAAIYVDSSTTEDIQFINTGNVLGSIGYYATDATVNRDVIINKGYFQFSIYLGGGDDVYNGAKGQLSKAAAVTGLSGDDILRGGKKYDNLYGGDGDDRLTGGGAGDQLSGESGADVLTGGAGKDKFIYHELDDSTPEAPDLIDFKTGDSFFIEINDFEDDVEEIDFVFIGKDAFSGTEGEIRFEIGTEFTTVYGDFDGNSIADFVVNVKGSHKFVDDDFSIGIG